VAGKRAAIGAAVFVLLIVALAYAGCDGQPAATPTATPARPAMTTTLAGTTLATVPPTASPSPTSGPTPSATLQSVRLWSLDLAGDQAVKLVEVTDGGALAWAVARSPDGREALFAQGRYVDGQRLTRLTLQAVDAAGAVREIGTLPAESQLMDLRWCRPGLALAIPYHPGSAASELYTVDLASGRMAFVGKGQQVSVLGTLAARAGDEAPPPPTPAAETGMPPFLSLHMVDDKVGWAMATGPLLLHTTDGGRHWADATPPGVGNDGFSPAFVDGSRAWVAFSREGNPVVTLCRTADGGRSWETSTFAQTFSSTVMGLDLDAADLASAWLEVIPLHGMNSSPAALFRTGDGGAHWTEWRARATRCPTAAASASQTRRPAGSRASPRTRSRCRSASHATAAGAGRRLSCPGRPATRTAA